MTALGFLSRFKRDKKKVDSFDTLSLSMMPLASATLKSATLVKNAQMETMVELVNDEHSGSLQIRPDQIAENFAVTPEDQAIIDKLSTLKSFDVYSLRTNLKTLGIEVDDASLELSDETKEKLRQYSLEFTRPLVLSLFGAGDNDNGEIGESGNLMKIFRDSDPVRVNKRLKIMSEKLGIPVEGLPQFLTEYSDLFLSGAYYRHTFETIQPDIARFHAWLAELKTMRDIAASPAAVKSCQKSDDAMKFMEMCVTLRMEQFKSGFEAFWKKMSKQGFDRMRRKTEENNVSMGALLCGLTVKMEDWTANFPDNNSGSPATRTKYLLEITPGLEKLQAMERDAQLMEANF
jgi:hypothetical protein